MRASFICIILYSMSLTGPACVGGIQIFERQNFGALEPTKITPTVTLSPTDAARLSVAGVVLIIAGGIYALILIIYLMNPPISDAVQGGFVVASTATGAVFGGISLAFQEVSEGFGCLLGGFSLKALYISVHAYSGDTPDGNDTTSTNTTPLKFNLRTKIIMPRETLAPLEEAEHDANDTQCKNCHQWIPERTLFLHENFCLRNNILCPKCENVFQKRSPEWKNHWHCPHDSSYGNDQSSQLKHNTVFHTPHRPQNVSGIEIGREEGHEMFSGNSVNRTSENRIYEMDALRIPGSDARNYTPHKSRESITVAATAMPAQSDTPPFNNSSSGGAQDTKPSITPGHQPGLHELPGDTEMPGSANIAINSSRANPFEVRMDDECSSVAASLAESDYMACVRNDRDPAFRQPIHGRIVESNCTDDGGDGLAFVNDTRSISSSVEVEANEKHDYNMGPASQIESGTRCSPSSIYSGSQGAAEPTAVTGTRLICPDDNSFPGPEISIKKTPDQDGKLVELTEVATTHSPGFADATGGSTASDQLISDAGPPEAMEVDDLQQDTETDEPVAPVLVSELQQTAASTLSSRELDIDNSAVPKSQHGADPRLIRSSLRKSYIGIQTASDTPSSPPGRSPNSTNSSQTPPIYPLHRSGSNSTLGVAAQVETNRTRPTSSISSTYKPASGILELNESHHRAPSFRGPSMSSPPLLAQRESAIRNRSLLLPSNISSATVNHFFKSQSRLSLNIPQTQHRSASPYPTKNTISVESTDDIPLSVRRELIHRGNNFQNQSQTQPNLHRPASVCSFPSLDNMSLVTARRQYEDDSLQVQDSLQVREAKFARWRESVRNENIIKHFPDAAMETRWADLVKEHQWSQLGKQKEAIRTSYRNSVIEQAMRNGDMLSMHNEALRRMQASANKHASGTHSPAS
ncbi:predicted protein [Histoplasma mississippiense (nom. inval.)]|uniref:predicted protein n=1 Tax=Ajellomyces capsulatus (strain NAm1 / WU24) TaxID=2059318 RepID=UPI000157BF19|nr:predicted protein [Histoplasma mississippiense (nom. inval.)]EDN06374.1 predicted protein [Histoplasma mississippiense (nom. inval.)]